MTNECVEAERRSAGVEMSHEGRDLDRRACEAAGSNEA